MFDMDEEETHYQQQEEEEGTIGTPHNYHHGPPPVLYCGHEFLQSYLNHIDGDYLPSSASVTCSSGK